MTTDTTTALREWARGMFTTEPATELVIQSFQGRFAAAGNPWVLTGDDHGLWLDFDAIPSLVGALSSGERAVLLIAASIGGNTEVNLSNGVCSLDRCHLDLVLAALAHANGSHRHVKLSHREPRRASARSRPHAASVLGQSDTSGTPTSL